VIAGFAMLFKPICKFLLSLLLLVLLLGLVTLNFVYPLTIGKTSILYSDFGKFYHSGQLFIQGKNSYSPVYCVKNKINTNISPPHVYKSRHSKIIQLGGNLNPPFFTLISFPFAYLSYPHALFLWTFLSILAGGLGILLLQQKLDPDSFSILASLLLLIGFFSYFPSFASLQFGQVTFLLLPLLVLGWRAAHEAKIIKAAIFLALAASLKPFIGLFLFYFVIRKQWRGLGVFIAIMLSCALIAAAFFGLSSYLSYYHTCQQISWAASNWNISLYGFLLRLVGGNEHNAALIPLPGLITFLYPLLTLLLMLAMIRFLVPQTHIDFQQKTDLDFSLIIVGMLLLSPLAWIYYFPFLSIPGLILWQFSKKGIYPVALPLLLATLILLSNIPISLISSEKINVANMPVVFLGATLYFTVLLGLMGLLFRVRHYLTGQFPRHFERIPPSLLLLIAFIIFLPSLQGIAKASHNWILNAAHYSKEYSFVSHQD
jgi:hypothetical protein